MISYDPSRAKQAVQFLVDSPYFKHHATKLRNTVEKPRALPFKDDAEVLNELLIIGRQNLQAMENLISVAEVKRSNKNDYQREYMAAKRQRDRKVLQLEALMSGKEVAPQLRDHVLAQQYTIWEREKARELKQHPGASWIERNEITRGFWARVEAELDALIEEAKASGPVKRKYRVIVQKPAPKTVLGQALANAIKKPVDKRR